MRKRVAGQALRVAAFAGLMVGSASLAGCSTLGASGFGDVTGSTGTMPSAGGQQSMPSTLKPIAPPENVAQGPYIPPADINGGSGGIVTGSTPSGTITFTVRAITTGADGRTLTGAAASISVTPPSPKIQISRGSDTSSSDCKAPSCAWIDVTMTGFAPDTSYSVMPYSGNGHNFSEPCKASTDSSGDTTCDDIRYDVSGETVYVTVQTADGTITSNSITWT